MSLKELFNKITVVKSLTNQSADSVGSEVESVSYHEADIIKEDRFIPPVDYSKPENFARYGLAKKYYGDAVRNIYKTYPYDGSLYEKINWENSSSYVDLYVLHNRYPRTNGYINFSYGGWGSGGAVSSDGYGLPNDLEYISFYGGPHIKNTVPRAAAANVWDPDNNRESNLKFDLDAGTTVEFWLKKDAFDETKTKKEVIFDLWNNENSSSLDYRRFRIELSSSGYIPDEGADPFQITLASSSYGVSSFSLGSSTVTTSSVADGTWNHYAVSLKNLDLTQKSTLFEASTSDRINIGTSWESPIGGATSAARPFTLAAWVYIDPDTPDDYPRVLSFGFERNFQYNLSTGKFEFVIRDSGGSSYTTATTTNITSKGQWHHVVATYSGGSTYGDGVGTMKIYIDGVHETSTGTTETSAHDIAGATGYIGGWGTASHSNFWDGYITEVGIWGGVLTAAEVKALYQDTTANLDTAAAASLLSWYRMGNDPDDSLDGTDTSTITNKIVDQKGGRDGYADNGAMAASQIASYAPANKSVNVKFYVNGDLNRINNITLGGLSSSVGDFSGSLKAHIGALVTSPSGSATPSAVVVGAGKLSASLDEFRYWKTQRSSKDIGRYWFTDVGGGSNTDLANATLGVYYKFNEGIVGVENTDLTILDYSGRVTNGTWTRGATYNSAIRNTGSAMVSASAATMEFRDPIVYSSHADVQAVLTSLEASGSVHDYTNNSSLFYMFPSWIQEEDSKGANELENLTQIAASYFDSLHLQIESVNNIKDFGYVSGSNKPNVFGNRLLAGHGLLAPELFLDADILEKLADRSEDKLFAKSLNDIKNTIYQNIYNNLIHIYKSKGTEKSFRNLIRCFGVDEEVVKLSLYGNNVEYELRESTTMSETRNRLIDFNHIDRFGAVVFSNSSSVNSNSVDYIAGSNELLYGYAFTLETEVLFPKKFDPDSANYANQNIGTGLSSSVFGVHSATGSTNRPTWNDLDAANFQVYVVRDESGSPNAKFALDSVNNGCITGSALTSSLFENVYDNSKWSLAVRVKPDTYPQSNFVSGSPGSHNWIVDFYGVQYEADVILNEFHVSGSILSSSCPPEFATAGKRVYVGAHRQNFTGSVLKKSDAKVAACRYWLDYLENDAIRAHARDVKNYGALHPYRNAYLFQNGKNPGGLGTARRFEVPQIETLALNWDFEQVTGSDASGLGFNEFVVADFSSGSTALQNRYGTLGNIVKAQHTGRGYGFSGSAAKVVDVDYFISAKQNLPENLYAQDMIKVLTTEDDLEFTRESRPINFFFAFEKSMYQTISEEMLNIFGSIVDFNNLIGEPVNKYRHQYKRLGKLRQLFYERVANTPDLDKYIEFYKWFDTSLGKMLEQLIPAAADFADNIRVMVENHLLARDKYQHKFPTLEMKWIDPEGGVNSLLPTSPGWQFTHHPISNLERENANWWLTRAERYTKYAVESESVKNPISSSVAGANYSKDLIFQAQRKSRNRLATTNYRFSVDKYRPTQRNTIRSGINYSLKKNRDIVYTSAAPAGPLVSGSNIPANVMLAFGADVEKWQDISDAIDPHDRRTSAKRKLGFNMNIAINKDETYSSMAGDIAAPFSLYSSSVDTGYNLEVVTKFSGNVELTNLHADVYGPDYETPMQGPFTEKFVGGREHRHIEINKYDSNKTGPNNLDSPTDRAEGFKLLFGLWLGGRFASGVSASPGAVGVVDPQYPDPCAPAVRPPYMFNRPKANLKRDESAKRPVNIKNILMTDQSLTSSISGTIMHNRIGNYQKNYQVIQTAGRSINDPFFQDQSFNFSLNPETTATRGRFPLEAPEVHSLLFDGSNDFVIAGTDGDWDPVVGGNAAAALPFSVSVWIRPAGSFTANDRIWSFGSSTGTRGLHLTSEAGNALLARVAATTWASTAETLSLDEWTHVTVTFAGGGTATPLIYLNGVAATLTTNSGTDPATLAGYGLTIGAFSTGGSYNIPAYICDLAVWRKVLSTADITEIYNSGRRWNLKSATCSNRLVAWYKMGDDSRDTYNGKIHDQMAFAHGTATNFPATAIQKVSPPFVGGLTQNLSGNLGYALPDRSGANSNKTVIVNRFSAPGGYEISSRGYMEPSHEEKSVYNALPYRNLSVRGSGSGDAGTLRVTDHLGYRRGLRTLDALYSGQFGIDSQYGTIPGAEYAGTGSWHKVNRNPRLRMEQSAQTDISSIQATYATGSRYDNANVSHPIPQSDRQYSWVTASLLPGAAVLEYDGPTSYAFMQNASSLDFDGTGDYLNIGTAATWDALIGGAGTAAKAFSLSAWINAETDGGTNYGRVFGFATTDRGVWWDSTNNRMKFYIYGATTQGAVVSSGINLNQWYHVVATFEGEDSTTGKGNLKLYINGVEDTVVAGGGSAVVTATNAIDGVDCTIGSATPSAVATWDGYIDEVSVWDVELTADQVAELYNNGTAKYLPQHSAAGNLLSWWRMGDGTNDSATIIYDQIGGHNGVAGGNPTLSTDAIGGSRYDGPITYKLENQFASASDFRLYQNTPNGLWYWGDSRTNTAYSAWSGLPTPFIGMNISLKDPINSSQNHLGYGGGHVAPSSPGLGRGVPLWSNAGAYSDSQWANRGDGVGGREGMIDRVAVNGWQGPSTNGPEAALMFNALMLHRNGPYGWPTFRQIQAGPHSHPVVRDQRKNNRLTIRNNPTYIINEGSALKGDTFIGYTEPPISSQHKVLTHTLVSTNKVVDPDGSERNIDQSLIYNHSFANKVDYFANVELNNKLNLKLDTNRGDLYFNRLNEILLNEVAGSTNETPFENLDKVFVNYRQTVYPAAYNTGRDRNRRRTNYSIAGLWKPVRADREGRSGLAAGHTGILYPWAGSPKYPYIPYASTWPLDGHRPFQVSATATVFSGSGILQNGFSGFGYYGEYTISGSGLYAQRGMYGSDPDGSTHTVPRGVTGVTARVSQVRQVYGGDAEWQAPAQANKQPYRTYDKYCEKLRLLGREYSIVPEFRISEHMDYYLNTKSGNFWADRDSFLDLTGSNVSDSSEDGFFKIYSNSDFVKLFSVVDEAYDEKPLVNGDIMKKTKLALRCSALIKFLPYKGFYPAERTVELCNLLSSSYGPYVIATATKICETSWVLDPDKAWIKAGTCQFEETAAAFRAFTEPLIGPGILYNTIKSGIAVENYLMRHARDMRARSADYAGAGVAMYEPAYTAATHDRLLTSNVIGSDKFREDYGKQGLLKLVPSGAFSAAGNNSLSASHEYYAKKLPFEAILNPRAYMSMPALRGLSGSSTPYDMGFIYDRGVGSGSISSSYGVGTEPKSGVAHPVDEPLKDNIMNASLWGGNQKDNYQLAIDNFVCETVDFFQPRLKHFVSAREDQFSDVLSGSTYAMKIRLHRTLLNLEPADQDDFAAATRKRDRPDESAFSMYNRPSAFGRPISSSYLSATNNTGAAGPSWVHVTPPYYHGICDATIIFSPEFSGKPSLDDIFNSKIYYERSGENYSVANTSTRVDHINQDNIWRTLATQLSSSVNLKEVISTVVPGTVTPKKRWLIQTKFETPVLNFADVSASLPVCGDATALGTTVLTPTKGMWHQYGSLCDDANGVFMSILPAQEWVSTLDTKYDKVLSLAEVCKFETGKRRIGRIRDKKVVSEAVVAVPFTVGLDGRRKFYRFSKRQRNGALRILNGQETSINVNPDILKLCRAMKKYVFPPKFDFVTTGIGRTTIDPFAMFVFEFEKVFTQQDLADIWQNLPPDVTEDTLETQEVTIQHSLLAEDFFDSDKRQINSEMRWMVFKVKQRAANNYNRYKMKGLSDDLSTVPNSINSPYTYNWPYDYFSLIELVKMDVGLQYASSGSVDPEIENMSIDIFETDADTDDLDPRTESFQ